MDRNRIGGTGGRRLRRRKLGAGACAGGNTNGCVVNQRNADPDEYADRHVYGRTHVNRDAQSHLGGANRHRDACCRRRRAGHKAPGVRRRW